MESEDFLPEQQWKSQTIRNSLNNDKRDMLVSFEKLIQR